MKNNELYSYTYNFNQVFENVNAYTNLYVFVYKYFNKEFTCQRRKHKRHGFDPWVRKLPWTREWQPTPVFLPGEFHGQRSLVGYSPWGGKESDTTERLTLSLQLKGFKNEKKKKGNVPGLLLQWRLRNPSGVPLRGGCLSRTECLYLACTQSACTHSPAPAGTVEEKCGWGFMETTLKKPVEGKRRTSNTHRIETFSEHKRRSMIPSCSYLVLLKNNET